MFTIITVIDTLNETVFADERDFATRTNPALAHRRPSAGTLTHSETSSCTVITVFNKTSQLVWQSTANHDFWRMNNGQIPAASHTLHFACALRSIFC